MVKHKRFTRFVTSLPENGNSWLLKCHASSHDDVVIQALVWLCMVWFGASYAKFKMTSHI